MGVPRNDGACRGARGPKGPGGGKDDCQLAELDAAVEGEKRGHPVPVGKAQPREGACEPEAVEQAEAEDQEDAEQAQRGANRFSRAT